MTFLVLEGVILYRWASVSPLIKCQAWAGVPSVSPSVLKVGSPRSLFRAPHPFCYQYTDSQGRSSFSSGASQFSHRYCVATQPQMRALSFSVFLSFLETPVSVILVSEWFEHTRLFIQQTSACLLCARHCARLCEDDRHTREDSIPRGLPPNSGRATGCGS